MKTAIFRLFIIAMVFMLLGMNTSCKKDKDQPDNSTTQNVERIALLLDYEAGYGGYIYPVYNPYVFFKNGTVVKSPYIPVDEINTGAVTKEVAANSGTWKQTGDKVNITWHNGDSSEKEWPGNNSIAAGKDEKLQGAFGSISGGGDLAVGGSVGILSYSKMSFTSDGWFTNEKVAGGGNSSVTAYSKLTTAGKYNIDGYTLTLRFNNGDVKRLFFCFYGNDKKVFRIAGRSYTKS